MNTLITSAIILFILLTVGCASNFSRKESSDSSGNKIVMKIESNNYLLSRVEKESSLFLIGTYGEDAVKEFVPPSQCSECIPWRLYYIYLITPISSDEIKDSIKIAIFSHSGRPGQQDKQYLMKIRKLSDDDAETVGADYLAIDLVTLGSEWSCVEKPFEFEHWLYKPSIYPKFQLNKKGEYCYYQR